MANVDVITRFRQSRRYVCAGYAAKQLPVFARLDFHGHGFSVQFRRQRFQRFHFFRFMESSRFLFLLRFVDVGCGGYRGEALFNKEISAVAVGYFHDVAFFARAFYVRG